MLWSLAVGHVIMKSLLLVICMQLFSFIWKYANVYISSYLEDIYIWRLVNEDQFASDTVVSKQKATSTCSVLIDALHHTASLLTRHSPSWLVRATWNVSDAMLMVTEPFLVLNLPLPLREVGWSAFGELTYLLLWNKNFPYFSKKQFTFNIFSQGIKRKIQAGLSCTAAREGPHTVCPTTSWPLLETLMQRIWFDPTPQQAPQCCVWGCESCGWSSTLLSIC